MDDLEPHGYTTPSQDAAMFVMLATIVILVTAILIIAISVHNRY